MARPNCRHSTSRDGLHLCRLRLGHKNVFSNVVVSISKEISTLTGVIAVNGFCAGLFSLSEELLLSGLDSFEPRRGAARRGVCQEVPSFAMLRRLRLHGVASLASVVDGVIP